LWAYLYPRRFGGGAYNGVFFLEQCWKCGATCRDRKNISYDSQTFLPYCQVIDGTENLEECAVFQEFMQRNETHIKGVSWK
jgi:hypothetical protein